MRYKNIIYALIIGLSVYGRCFAQQDRQAWTGITLEDGVNIRSDSTVSAESILKVDKNKRLSIVSESYDWYKVRIPVSATAFVKKELILPDAEKKELGSASKDNVNIRLRPDTSAPILGKLKLNDPVVILTEERGWYKIEPTRNCYGWINKKFVKKIEEEPAPVSARPLKADKPAEPKEKAAPAAVKIADNSIIAQGLVRPKVITGLATHKLVRASVTGSTGKSLYLLNSSKVNLDEFIGRRVKLSGKVSNPSAKNPTIEVDTIEVAD